MNCEDFRQAIGADPAVDTPQLQAHAAGCVACTDHVARLRDMDDIIRRALTVDADLPAVDLPPVEMAASGVNAVDSAGARLRRRALPLALAASITLVLASVLWFALPGESLASQLVTHVGHESKSMVITTKTVGTEDLQRVLAKSGVALRPEFGTVSYAMSCEFHGNWVPHLVVQTLSGPVTVLLLPQEESVRQAQSFEEDGYSGLLLPAPRGALAVIGRDAPLEQVAAQVQAAVRYLP